MQLVIMTMVGILVLAVVGLRIWRWSDERALDAAWERLEGARLDLPQTFEPSLVEQLPAPARGFFLYAIRPGTPIRTAAHIEMHGEMSLGTREQPNYLPMYARQLLAAPYGFIWRVEAGRGLMRFSGADGADPSTSWSRFWLLDTIPVVRAGGGPDHRRGLRPAHRRSRLLDTGRAAAARGGQLVGAR